MPHYPCVPSEQWIVRRANAYFTMVNICYAAFIKTTERNKVYINVLLLNLLLDSNL